MRSSTARSIDNDRSTLPAVAARKSSPGGWSGAVAQPDRARAIAPAAKKQSARYRVVIVKDS
jgi:hypothetical protein